MRKTFIFMIAGLSLACAAERAGPGQLRHRDLDDVDQEQRLPPAAADLRAAGRDPDHRGRHRHREHRRTSAAASRSAAAPRSTRTAPRRTRSSSPRPTTPATWTGGNPKTGTWRNACNEWGNLTLMGAAYISENVDRRRTPPAFRTARTSATMEGLVAAGPADTRRPLRRRRRLRRERHRSPTSRCATAARSSRSTTSSTASRSAASVAARRSTTSRS